MPRIQVYTDVELKRRIKLAAAKHDVPVTQYCLEAIQERLIEDDFLEEEKIELRVTPRPENNVLADIRALREKILVRRQGELVTRDVLSELREERDEELSGLH